MNNKDNNKFKRVLLTINKGLCKYLKRNLLMEIRKLFIIMVTITKEKLKESTRADGGHIIIAMDKSTMEYL